MNINDNKGVPPALDEVSMSWVPVAVGDNCEESIAETLLLAINPNPSSGQPILRLTVSESDPFALLIMDLSGRIVWSKSASVYSEGDHSITVNRLSPGVYYCRVTSGEFTATQRFVVIE